MRRLCGGRGWERGAPCPVDSISRGCWKEGWTEYVSTCFTLRRYGFSPTCEACLLGGASPACTMWSIQLSSFQKDATLGKLLFHAWKADSPKVEPFLSKGGASAPLYCFALPAYSGATLSWSGEGYGIGLLSARCWTFARLSASVSSCGRGGRMLMSVIFITFVAKR